MISQRLVSGVYQYSPGQNYENVIGKLFIFFLRPSLLRGAHSKDLRLLEWAYVLILRGPLQHKRYLKNEGFFINTKDSNYFWQWLGDGQLY